MTASPKVITEILASALPVEGQAFVAAVIDGETPQTVKTQAGVYCCPWNILYSGAGNLVGTAGLENPADAAYIVMVGVYRYWNGPMDETGFPAWSGGRLANGNFSTAYGGPQITRTTWRDACGSLTQCDEQSQISFAWRYAQQMFAAHAPGQSLLEVLKTAGSALSLVTTYLGAKPFAVWPGGCDGGFSKRYAANMTALQASAPGSVPISVVVTDSGGRRYRGNLNAEI